ncbi:MAG: hypothetical protein J7604_03465 [Sporocytophaga sp.]|uniref:hypothetical protein n=1 Tax=Sporocytophaga sp. TaxID=2231183 RepID=UPI001B24569B|nr:hypothetical protein [Sporocytophaga sp.]MBO9699240.1 hypothetical protein [Sporocytophaga sp.]
MGVDKNEENRKLFNEIVTPEPPQRMYPLGEPWEEQDAPSKRHGTKPETKENKK